MPEKLNHILSTATFRQASLTSFGSVINGILGAVFFFVLAKYLGNVYYGQFSLIITAVTLVSGIANLGSDQALIKYVPKAFNYAKTVFLIKAASSLFLSFIIILLSPNWLGATLSLGIFSQLAFSYALALSQATQKYLYWTVLLVGTNLLRLILLMLLIPQIRLFNANTIYIICPLLGFVVYGLLTQFRFILVPSNPSGFKEIFSFNKWATAFSVVSAIASRLDIFLTAKYASLSATGTYALASQLILILPQLTTALGAVTAPKFASFAHHQANSTYLVKSLRFSSFLAIVSSFGLSLFARVVIWYTGDDFATAWVPFLILLSGMALSLALTPLRDSILYYYSRPQFFFWTGLIQIGITLFLSPILIPLYGLIGSSVIVLATQVIHSVMCINYYYYLSKKHE